MLHLGVTATKRIAAWSYFRASCSARAKHFVTVTLDIKQYGQRFSFTRTSTKAAATSEASTATVSVSDASIHHSIESHAPHDDTYALLGQKLLSYPTLQAAYIDRQIDMELIHMMNQAIVKDVYTVMRHCLLNNETSMKERGAKLLSLEFGQLLHTLVLPQVKRTVPWNLLQPVLDMGVATLRIYQKEAKRLSADELATATELFDKMQSIQVYLDGDHVSGGDAIEGYQNMIRLALNQLLGCYSEWSSSRWRTAEEAKRMLQDAELLLLREASTMPEQILCGVSPDLASFVKLLGAWGKVDTERAKEIFELILDLCHQGVLVEKHAIVETYLSTAFHCAADVNHAVAVVQNMADKHLADPLVHPKPREATFVKLCGLLHHDALNLTANIQRMNSIAQAVRVPFNHPLVNAVISAYAKAECISAEQKLELCRNMIDFLDAARESVYWSEDQLPITYGQAIRAWSDCASEMNVQTGYHTDEAAQQARMLWDNAIDEHVPLPIQAHNHVIRAHKYSPKHASQIFEHIQKQATVRADLLTWKYLFEAYEHGTESVEDAEQAEVYLNQMMMLQRLQRPNRYIFNSVIASWTSLGSIQGVERAESVLDRLCNEYESQLQVLRNDPYRANVQAKPLEESFRGVVMGYTRHGDATHLKRVTDLAKRMLQMENARMQAPSHMRRYMSSVQLDEQLLNRIHFMYLQHYQGDEDVEELMQSLRRIVVVSEKGFQDILNSKSHNKVQEIVELMERKLSEIPPAAKQDRLALYNVGLHFIADAADGQKSPMAAEKCLLIMGRTGLIPDRITYSNLMKAWTKIGSFPAIARAEEHLMTLVDLNLEAASDSGTASLYSSLQLDASCFNVVMNAYSKLKTDEGYERVRQLYALMSSASKTLLYLVPDDNSIRTFLESATFELADSTLRDVLARADISGSKIPLSFFAVVLNKWATSGHHKAGEKAEQVLRLQQTYSKRDQSAAMRTISYNVAIKGIFRTQPIDAESAKRLLEEMIQNADRNPMVQPDQVTYNTVMNCYQRRGNPGDDDCCLSILRSMIERGTAPNAVSISICMDSLRNSRRPDRVEQTEMLLHLFQEKYNNNGSSPNLFLLTLKVLNETDGGPDHVLKAMELFKEAAFTGSLTPEFFALLINFCNKHLTNPRVRVTTIRKLMVRCMEVGMVSRLSLDSFRDAVSEDVFREVLKISLTANIAQVKLGDFPHSWKRPMKPAKQSLLFRQASERSGGRPDSVVNGANA